MLFLEEGLFSWYTRHTDEQQGVSCFRDTKASAGLFSGVKEKADILKKKAVCNQNKFFNFGKEACYGLPDKSSLCGTRFQLSSAENMRTINSRQPCVEIPILLCYKHTAFCLGVEIFLEKMCGQRAAVSCQYNQPFWDYYQPVLDYWENEKVV